MIHRREKYTSSSGKIESGHSKDEELTRGLISLG